MDRWKYRVARIYSWDGTYEHADGGWHDLNELGERGWELATVDWDRHDPGMGYAIFKRQKEKWE